MSIKDKFNEWSKGWKEHNAPEGNMDTPKDQTLVVSFQQQRMKRLEWRICQLESLLEEACDLMEDTLEGKYTPDHLTTQPWRNALAQKDHTND